MMNKRKLYHLIVLVSLLTTVLPQIFYGQNNVAKATTNNEFISTADSLIDQKKYKEAIPFLEKTVTYYEKNTDQEKLAIYLNTLARSYMTIRKLDEGKKLAERALRISTQGLPIYPNEEARAYENISDYYNRISKYDLSLSFDKKVLKTRKSFLSKNHKDIGDSYLNIALGLYMKGRFDESLVFLDSAGTILKQDEKGNLTSLYRYYGITGTIYHASADFEKAINYYKRATTIENLKPIPNKLSIARINGNIGGAYSDLWDYEKAIKYIKLALVNFEKEKGEDNYDVAINYMNLGRVYGRQGEPMKALEYTKKALSINLKVYGEKHAYVGHSYDAMAEIHKLLNDNDKELFYREKALANFLDNLGDKHKRVVVCYDHIGRIHSALGNHQLALEYFERAISIGIETLGAENTITAHIYEDIADVYAAKGRNEEAALYYQKNLVAKKKNYGEKHGETAKNYLAQGRFFDGLGEYDKALTQFNEVLKMYEEEIKETLEAKVVNQEFKILGVIQKALEGKALCLFQKYIKNGNIKDLSASGNTYEILDRVSEKMRDVITSYEDKLQFAAVTHNIPKGAIETNFLLYEKMGESEMIEKAFFHSERSKSQTLRALLNRNDFASSGGHLEETIASERNFRKDRARYLSLIQNERDRKKNIDSLKLEEYSNALFRTNMAYDSILSEMKTSAPNYFRAGHYGATVKVSQIQSKLDENTTFLEYFASDSTLYAFIVTKKELKMKRLNFPELSSSIVDYKKALSDKNIDMYRAKGHELYRNLIAPISGELSGNHLIIVPDSYLWDVNFELLLTEDHKSSNPKEFPYLLRDYAISYANSGSLLFESKKSPTAATEKGCLAFSYSDSTFLDSGQIVSMETLRSANGDLPGSRQEIREIASLVPGEYYFGSEAREANFKAKASKYPILHLALHGEVDHIRPENSKLYFTGARDSLEDNYLYNHELFAMQLSANLVVLSACNTGSGKVSSGEGIMSLGSAFQYAGAESLLLTRWEVSDSVSPLLMKAFYTNLKNGMDKATALQQAKLKYLETADVFRANPFYWGSFYLVGDTSPMKLGSTSNWLYILISLLLLVVSLYLFRKHRQKI